MDHVPKSCQRKQFLLLDFTEQFSQQRKSEWGVFMLDDREESRLRIFLP